MHVRFPLPYHDFFTSTFICFRKAWNLFRPRFGLQKWFTFRGSLPHYKGKLSYTGSCRGLEEASPTMLALLIFGILFSRRMIFVRKKIDSARLLLELSRAKHFLLGAR